MQLLIIVKEIHFQWVPVHIGLEINQKADVLAKEGKKKDTNIETLELSDMFILHIYVYMYISSCIYITTIDDLLIYWFSQETCMQT